MWRICHISDSLKCPFQFSGVLFCSGYVFLPLKVFLLSVLLTRIKTRTLAAHEPAESREGVSDSLHGVERPSLHALPVNPTAAAQRFSVSEKFFTRCDVSLMIAALLVVLTCSNQASSQLTVCHLHR